MTSYEFERALVYLAEQIIKTFGKDVGVQEPKQEPKEPLIKDEKIRKAVRAWGYSPLTFKQRRRKGYCQFWYLDKYICFRGEFEELKDKELYTIAELCGEEE